MRVFKNYRFKIVALPLLLVLVFNILIGCEFFGDVSVSVAFNLDNIVIELGDEYDIMSDLTVSDPIYASDIALQSYNESIVSCSAAQTLRAMSVGKTIIKASIKNSKSTINVSVVYKDMDISVYSYGSIFQEINNTSPITFAAVVSEYVDPNYAIEWYVNEVKQAISGEYFNLTPLNEPAKTLVSAKISGKNISDSVEIYVYDPSEIPSEVTVEQTSAGVTLSSDAAGFWEVTANSKTVYSLNSTLLTTFEPDENGIYLIEASFYGNPVLITNDLQAEDDKFVFVKEGSLLIENIEFEYDNCYPDSFVTWEVPNVYDIDLLSYKVTIIDKDNQATELYSLEDSQLFMGTRVNTSDIIDITKEYRIVITVFYGDNMTGEGEISTNALPLNAITYLSKKYLDKNYYITSDEEFFDIYKYIMWMRIDSRPESSAISLTFKTYMSYNSVYPARRLSLMAWAMSGPPGYYYLDTASGGVYANGIMSVKITFLTENEPSLTTDYTSNAKSLLMPHLNFGAKTERELFIESAPLTTERISNSNELFFVVERGFRPNVSSGSKAEELYNYAKNLLKTIITPEMDELEKIHAIYDYILWRTHYDRQVENVTSIYEAVKYAPFYLESVLTDTNPYAVCDGLSKAFSLLCNMEGIQAIRVVGRANIGRNSWGEHAWNKVLYNGEWYLVDTTWADYEVSINQKTYEVATHEYLMASSGQLSNTHRENNLANYPKATSKPFMLFSTADFSGDENIDFSFFDTNEADLTPKLTDLVDYIKQNKPASKSYSVGSGANNTTSIDFYGAEFYVPAYNEKEVERIVKELLKGSGLTYFCKYVSTGYMHIQIDYT